MSQLQDTIQTKGELDITLFDKDGKIKVHMVVPNLITTTGKNWIASRVTGSPSAMSHMAVGDGDTAPDIANTTLEGELGRVALSSQNTVGNVSTFSATFPAGVATGALTEAGILNANSAGTLLNRAVFPVVNKEINDVMAIAWTLTNN